MTASTRTRALRLITAEPFRRSLVADPKDGPLPLILVILTVVSGVVDAVSILGLGRVFVANMTGNVVFIGFALAGAAGFSLVASLAALAGFLVGAGGGGWLIGRPNWRRGTLLGNCIGIELALLVATALMSAFSGDHLDAGVRDGIAALAAVAMGLQNSVARRLAVADLTTTVLTMTLTGIASDLRTGHRGLVLARRLLAVASMLVGAIGGALLVLHVSTAAGLTLAAGLLAVAGLATTIVARPARAWN